MTFEELISEFDILFEDLATAGSKGLDTYEKSVCYTYAQEKLVEGYASQNNYPPIDNLIRTDFKTVTPSLVWRTAKRVVVDYEYVKVISYIADNSIKEIPALVVPQVVIDSMMSMPYQYPPKDLVYVVVGENALEVFPPLNYDLQTLVTRYVAYPPPVILEDLSSDTINGISVATLPVLSDASLRDLVNAAVQYAIQIYVGQPEKEANDNTRNQQ